MNDAFTHWQGPYGDVRVSPLRERLLRQLPDASRIVDDEMQAIEHSVEAKLPFLQHANRHVRIVPILVPAMAYARMDDIAAALAHALDVAMRDDGLEWGRDVALVATDAVHYGDEGWNGRDFAFFGADADGYAKAVAHERAILRDCFEGELRREAPLNGTILGYATSLGEQRIDVADLDGMGVTAPATLRHWVGYAAVGYR